MAERKKVREAPQLTWRLEEARERSVSQSRLILILHQTKETIFVLIVKATVREVLLLSSPNARSRKWLLIQVFNLELLHDSWTCFSVMFNERNTSNGLLTENSLANQASRILRSWQSCIHTDWFELHLFRDNDYLDEVLEKQADMIRYLQQHNANLGKRLMKLTAQQSRSSLNAV